MDKRIPKKYFISTKFIHKYTTNENSAILIILLKIIKHKKAEFENKFGFKKYY